jgi:hypothetical protein
MMSAEELKKAKRGPIRHKHIDPLGLDMMKWSYEVVGHYLYRTLEQWELGFMRDTHMDREVILWHRIACAFITYHRRMNLPLRGQEEEKQLLGSLIRLTCGGCTDDAETAMLESLHSPEGWEDEPKRLKALAQPSGDVKRWTPPPQFADWQSRL